MTITHALCTKFKLSYLSKNLSSDINLSFDINLSSDKKKNYFSDGCAALYKNCENFINLCHHNIDFNIDDDIDDDTEWTFFATNHKKSVCDGHEGL